MVTANPLTNPPPGALAGGGKRRRLICAALLALTVPLGLVWRLAPLHLPSFAYKYGGSALWAIAVYWLVALALPRRSASEIGLASAIIALSVELLKLLWWPPLDHFRRTLAGKLLLGRYFTLGALVAYAVAIASVAVLDRWLKPGRQLSRP